MKSRFCLIIVALLFASSYVKADELNVYLKNTDMSPVRIQISDISTIKFKPNRFIVNLQDNTSNKFYFSDTNKISFSTANTLIERTNADASTANVFPNPVGNHLTINNIEKMYGSDIYIYSITGLLVEKHTQWNGETINVSNLTPGVYFININSTTLKFIKQ